jgi:TonB family protein
MLLLSGVEVEMLRRDVLLVMLMVLPTKLLTSQTGTSQGAGIALLSPPSAATGPNNTWLVLELDRAIVILKRGLKENWETRDQYLTAFDKTTNTDRTGQAVIDAKNYVEAALSSNLRIHQIWDEGSPIGVEVQSTIIEFTQLRNKAKQGNTVELPPILNAATLSGKVKVSAGVAASMLKTKVAPFYPAKAFENHVSGTVVLQATINTKGSVEALRVINGPLLLQQAALDAVRKWTYRPYLLNNRPVEVETTINVVFEPSR